MLTLIALMLLQQAPAPAAPPATPAPAPAVTAPVRRAAPATATVEIRVVDRGGRPAAGAQVTAEGPSSRDGVADTLGALTFRTMPPGTYRLRAVASGFVTLEKEVAVRSGGMSPIEFALSAAPPAPKVEAPPAPAAPAAPVIVSPNAPAGEVRIVSLTDVAENSLSGRDPIRTVPVGCSGFSRAQLMVVREGLPAATKTDADDMLYVIAGEASITVGDKTQAITSGWFSVVPRGVSRTVVRRGRNPLILLSIASGGAACGAGAAAQ